METDQPTATFPETDESFDPPFQIRVSETDNMFRKETA